MKMPVEIRTALRKLLRNHPKILDHVKIKADVNNLKRDELFELADKLEYDFIAGLQDMDLFTMHWENNMEQSKDPNFTAAFTGEIEIELDFKALGKNQKNRVRIDYDHTPEWQYACANQNRLKFRRAGTSWGTSLEIIDYEPDSKTGHMTACGRHWIGGDKVIFGLLEGPIMNEVHSMIDHECWEEDQTRRKEAGLSAGDKSKAWMFQTEQ